MFFFDDESKNTSTELLRTLYELLENKHSDLLTRVEAGSWDEADIAELQTALASMKG